MCDDWVDLVECVMQKFVTTMGVNPQECTATLIEFVQNSKLSEAADGNGFTKSQLDCLHLYYSQDQDAEDTVGDIIEIYKRTCSVTKTRLNGLQALLSQGIITSAQYMSLKYRNSGLSPCEDEPDASIIAMIKNTDGDKNIAQRLNQIEVLKGKS